MRYFSVVGGIATLATLLCSCEIAEEEDLTTHEQQLRAAVEDELAAAGSDLSFDELHVSRNPGGAPVDYEAESAGCTQDRPGASDSEQTPRPQPPVDLRQGRNFYLARGMAAHSMQAGRVRILADNTGIEGEQPGAAGREHASVEALQANEEPVVFRNTTRYGDDLELLLSRGATPEQLLAFEARADLYEAHSAAPRATLER